MNDLQQINNDPVVEFFTPLANESRVSVGALIQDQMSQFNTLRYVKMPD